jgi:enoyl-CoA hydratase/carnithine racemase
VGLTAQLEAAQGDARVRAIVITGSKGKFSGGFDITQLKARTEGKSYAPKLNGCVLVLRFLQKLVSL